MAHLKKYLVWTHGELERDASTVEAYYPKLAAIAYVELYEEDEPKPLSLFRAIRTFVVDCKTKERYVFNVESEAELTYFVEPTK